MADTAAKQVPWRAEEVLQYGLQQSLTLLVLWVSAWRRSQGMSLGRGVRSDFAAAIDLCFIDRATEPGASATAGGVLNDQFSPTG
jgi:hypothetical protein